MLSTMTYAFTPRDVHAVASLANIPIDETQAVSLAEGFTKTMIVLDQLQRIDTRDIHEDYHAVDMENVMRDDIVDESRMFTQEQALSNAPRTYDGYIVVDQVISYHDE